MKRKGQISLLIKQMRPKQWVKNVLVFPVLIFSFDAITFQSIYRTIIGFCLFSFVASCVYILNDFVDRNSDKHHPEKKYRPIASGDLNPYLAIFFGIFLLVVSLFISYQLSHLFTYILIFYFVMNVLYSLKLKHIVILDVMIIAAGFVLRVLGGGVIINSTITPWFLICVMLLSLFMAITKRRNELIILKDAKENHRKVLKFYSIELLDQMNLMVCTSTLITYSLFTFNSIYSKNLMWTIPLVIYGLFRYLYLLHIEKKGGKPESLIFEDKSLLITIILYITSVLTIMNIGS